MPMRGPCIVRGCNNQGVHLFPKDENLKIKWLRALRMDPQDIDRKDSVCSKHFKPDDYWPPSMNSRSVRKLNVGIITRPVRRLKKSAVPSIYPWTITMQPVPVPKKPVIDDPPTFNASRAIRTYSKPKPVVKSENQFLGTTSYREECGPLQTEVKRKTEDDFSGVKQEIDEDSFLKEVQQEIEVSLLHQVKVEIEELES